MKYDYPLYRPPSEANSLIFQLTLGCSHNGCSFCGMYKTKQFKIRPIEEVLADILSLPHYNRSKVQRIFIADGDALIYPQKGLVDILSKLGEMFPNLTRIGAYASPNSLEGKSVQDLIQLHQKTLRTVYLGLECAYDQTVLAVNKGFSSETMFKLCRKAHKAGLKLSVTAILGLAGQKRSLEHAQATAHWVNQLSPEFFSLLSLFQRHNGDFLRSTTPLTNGAIIQEALALVRTLSPRKTILRSNHVSNILQLSGSYPKDRLKIIAQAEKALFLAQKSPAWFHAFPVYSEDMF